MVRRGYIESQQDKLDRIQRLTRTIAQIELYLQFFDNKGKNAINCQHLNNIHIY